jgi:NADPH-dependent ferric siderophore reductase
VTTAVRREPPRFRRVEVHRVEQRSPRLLRVTLHGGELSGFTVPDPAASVRLLVPSPGSDELVMPTWNGNEFLLPGGGRPALRTLTPRRVDAGSGALEVEIVVHGGGVLSTWAEAIAEGAQGAPAAVSGPGRGYRVDEDAPAFVLAGDETAIPAISQLLEVLPRAAAVDVHVEVADPDARLDLPDHPRASVRWHDLPAGAVPGAALVDAVAAIDLLPDARVWAAGEAAAVQRIRRHLFDERGVPRSHATVRGYWKHGRAGDASES